MKKAGKFRADFEHPPGTEVAVPHLMLDTALILCSTVDRYGNLGYVVEWSFGGTPHKLQVDEADVRDPVDYGEKSG